MVTNVFGGTVSGVCGTQTSTTLTLLGTNVASQANVATGLTNIEATVNQSPTRMARDSSGNLYTVVASKVGGIYQIFCYKSTNGGVTWADTSFPQNGSYNQ